MVDFTAWAKTDNKRIVLAQLNAWDGSKEVSLYVGEDYYLDGTTEYLDRLIDPLIIRRSLAGAFSGRGEASVGAITINNADREFDDWVDYGWRGRDFTLLFGDPAWDLADFETIFKGVSERIEGDDTTLTLFTRDLYDKLDRPINERILIIRENGVYEPMPICFGNPKNVPVPRGHQISGDTTERFIFAPWASGNDSGNDAWDEVYENGKATTKSTTEGSIIGASGATRTLVFDVSDPEGVVTMDPNGVLDEDTENGTRVFKPGEILQLALTYEIGSERDVAVGGSTTTVQLAGTASSEDDFYNGAGTDAFTTGYIYIYHVSDNTKETSNVSDYDGATRTVTLGTTLSTAAAAGDLYIIVTENSVHYGALTDSDLDTSSFTSLDTDAPYPLGVWDRTASMTYLELLDTILPGGFWYYWTRESKLKVGLLKEPGTSALTIDTDETYSDITVMQEQEPIYRARVGFNKNWSLTESPDSSVSPSRADFLSRKYLWMIAQDHDILDSYPESKPKNFRSFLVEKHDGSSGGRDDAETEANRLLDLFGVARKRVGVQTLAAPFTVDLHDTVTVKDRTYGMSNGEDFRVVGITEHPLEGRTELELWG